jgi:ubiquinone/menaquinone biosynthesis C-methylase UbiE
MTNTTKSYDLDRFDLDTETKRLRAQALLGWRQESRILTMFGLHDGMTALELGSGPGFITEQLLALLPNSPIICLDNEPTMLERAKNYLGERAEGRARFVQASITETGLPDNSVDFAVARFLFQHLPDPVGAAKEVLRVLKPGGRLALIDVDDGLWGIEDPFLEEAEALFKKFIKEQAERGGNRLVGRRFWRILRSAGFQPLELEAILYHSDELGLEPFRPLIGYDPVEAARQVKAGQVSQEDDDIFRRDSEQFWSAPGAFILVLLLAACGQKP